MLTLGGTVCGSVIAAEGGDISAPVIREPKGGVVRKRLGTPVPEPIVLSIDLSLHPVVYDWIGEFWSGAHKPRNGSVISLDMNNQKRSELVFDQAVITATTIPPMDAASKSPCALTVELAPAKTKRNAVSGAFPIDQKPKKPWLSNLFQLEIKGLDAKRVSRIDPLPVAAEGGAIDFPDLRVLLSSAGADAWFAWYSDFVLSGHGDSAKEKSGLLSFLAPDMQSKLGQVKLHGLGITRLAPETGQKPIGEQIGRLSAGLYCQSMELAVP